MLGKGSERPKTTGKSIFPVLPGATSPSHGRAEQRPTARTAGAIKTGADTPIGRTLALHGPRRKTNLRKQIRELEAEI